MSPVELPEDVLVIHYADLAPDYPPTIRLQTLSGIGGLLAATEQAQRDQPYALDDLVEDEQARHALQAWLIKGEEASKFWQLEEISSYFICPEK
jgi:hypothetical protein